MKVLITASFDRNGESAYRFIAEIMVETLYNVTIVERNGNGKFRNSHNSFQLEILV